MIPFGKLLAEGKPFLGTFVQSASPEFIEAAAYAGFRFAAIDLEHTYYGTEKAAELVRAGEAAGLSMLVRVPALDAVWIKKSLDLGAAGVIVPNIDTAEQAAQAVALSKFTPEGVKNFDEIIRTPGLTAVFLGPVDLSVAMGLKGDTNAPEVREALLEMVRRAGKGGVPVGALGLDPVFVRELFAEGLDFLAYGIDTILMYQTCREIMRSVFGAV